MRASSDPATAANTGEGQTMTGKIDKELLKLYSSSSSEAAFRELVRRHSGVVVAAARRRLGGDHVMAEDAVQQTFILLARHPARAARAISLAAWLHRASTYEASNLLRREIRQRTRAMAVIGQSEALSPDQPASWISALPHLDEALASLNETDRSLLILHHMEGLSYAEVGQRLHCSSGSAQRRGHRALEKLAARLRRRKVTVPLAALASGLAQAVMPNPAHAAVAGRALAAGGTAGTGAGLLAGVLSPLALGTAAALVTSTAVFWAVRSSDPTPATPPVTLAKALVPDKTLPGRPSAPPVVSQPAFKAEKEDDKLTPDELAFITLAKSDPAAAMAWARTNFPAQSPLGDFLKSAVRALADRDLPVADRLLVHAGVSRSEVFEGIFASRLKRDFAGAVRWADEWSLSNPNEQQSSYWAFLNYDSGEWRPDLRQALAASRSPQMRESLIHMESRRLMAEDEAGLELLAESLTGEERKRVLEYHLSVLLIRGDERASEALLTIRPEILYETREMALRNPAMILDYHMSQPGKYGQNKLSGSAANLWAEWEREDPEAAIAWSDKFSDGQLSEQGMVYILVKRKGEGQLK